MNDNNELQLSKLVPFLGSIIVFLGAIRLVAYYSSFGISIVNYLDFSEILTSFLDIIVIAVSLFIMAIIQNFILRNKSSDQDLRTTEKDVLNEDNLLRRLKKYSQYIKAQLPTGLLTILLLFAFNLVFRLYSIRDMLFTLMGFIGGLLIIVVLFEIQVKHKMLRSSKFFRQFFGLTILTLFVLVLVVLMANNEAKSVKGGKKYIGTKIMLEDNQILISDSSTYYIGNTTNYVFIHHELDKTTEVIPMRNVKRVWIKINNR